MNTPEQRLEQLREKAWQEGVVPGRGVDVIGGPIPRKPGYYGEPVVKPPVWTWEIPLYLFFGGIGGMSAVIAFGAYLFHQVDLARTAMWTAAIAGARSFRQGSQIADVAPSATALPESRARCANKC
jgi:hypothetical protein